MPSTSFLGLLHPEFCWSQPSRRPISTVTPPIPRQTGPWMRRFWGSVHRLLARFSQWYCPRFGIQALHPIFPLPFGLVLKWSDRTSINEAVAMQLAHAGGIPAPKVLCYGEHPGSFNEYSILMTRLPGYEWYNHSEYPFKEEDEQPWFSHLKECIDAMRQWKSPFPDGMICSTIGGEIKSIRVRKHLMGPFQSQKEFLDYINGTPANRGFKSDEEFEQTCDEARKLYDKKHRVVFTHGDFQAHNILIDDSYQLTGFLDWESAGWCPEYWDFCTAMMRGQESWWYQAMEVMSEGRYAADLESDRAVRNLTVDSWAGW